MTDERHPLVQKMFDICEDATKSEQKLQSKPDMRQSLSNNINPSKLHKMQKVVMIMMAMGLQQQEVESYLRSEGLNETEIRFCFNQKL